jgi:predicted transcriptional regulator
MSVQELEVATSLYAKTIGSRLSELNKSGAVERRDAEGGGRYKVTTTGVHWLHSQLQKKFPKMG